MNQPHTHHRHSLRDSFGLMLGFVVAFLAVAPIYDASIAIFLRQIAPYAMLASIGVWQILWGLSLFFALVVGTRFVFAMMVQVIAGFLAIIALRLSLSRKRGG